MEVGQVDPVTDTSVWVRGLPLDTHLRTLPDTLLQYHSRHGHLLSLVAVT